MNSHHTFSSLAGKLWWLGLVLLSLSWSAVAGGASSREGGDHEGNAPTVAFTVDSPADAVDANPGNGVCATATGECTLRAAVQETNALPGADTIVVPAGTYRLTIAGANEDAAATGDLDIRANLNLVGAGSQQTIIDGDGQVTGDRVFHLLFQDIYVTVSDLTVRGGVSGANGGGFYSRSHLTLQSVRVLANQANWGGGIWNTGTLIINDSLVRDNHATGRGGGLYTEYNPATINHTTFAVNTADDGGGLFSFSSALTIEDCHLTGNTAVDQGGGLYQDLSASGLNNTSFAGNAAAYGGALYNESATLTISNSSLYQNTATGDGGAVYEGGYPNSPHLILTASMVASNTAGGSGGGIFNGGDFIDAILEVTNSTISGNTAGSNGGGIYHWGDLKVIHTTITGNTATLEGGGFYRWDGPVNFKGNVIAGNTAATFPDCRGSVYSAGYNLIGILSGCGINTNTGDQYGSESNPIDPRLGPLADNGGLTRTHAPYHDSPAVDAGDPAGCTDLAGNLVAADQRDFVRPVDGNVDGSEVCDLGAVELGSAASRDFSLYASPEEVELCAPSPAVYDLLVFSVLGFDTPVNLAASGQPAGTTVTFDPDPITPGSAASLTVGNTSAAEAGNYTISIGGQALTHTHTIEVGLALRNQTPGNAELRRPPDGANQVLLRPTFVWWAATQADSYTLEVATDDDFNNVVYSVTMDLTRHTMATSLLPQTLYFWRVRTHNVCGDDSQPAVFRFTTDRLPPFIVNSTADAVDNAPGDGVCATATNECTLRAAVQEANAAATSDTVVIRLPSGTYILTLVGADEDAAATGDLDITGKVAILGVTEQGAAGHRQESLTVAGNPVIIDGNGLVTGDRVFHILDGGRASLDSLTIQGGRGNNGGAILNSGVLTLTAGLLTVNEATGYGFVGGGALYSNGTATIINTTLSDNTASDRAGAIYNDTGTLTLDSSVITGNTAEYGGGLFTLWGITTITNSTISYNSSNHTGGGIYADNGSFTLAQSLLNGNTAVTDGGGIWDYNAPAYINNSTVTANSANGNGGGIYVNGLYGPGAAILNNATVTNNWAIGAGGGTYNYFGTVLLKNSILALNTTPEATPDCAGGVTSEGYNVVGDSDGCGYIASVGDQVGDSDNPLDPRLGPLQDNGGPTLTQALLADSPAVDAGRPTGCKDYFGRRLLTDQRGYQRVIDGDLDGQDVCDAGAYEYGSAGQPDFGLYTIPDLVDVCTLADGAASVYATSLLGFHSPLTLSASGQPAGSTVSFAPNPLTPPGPSAMTISDTGSAPPDRYLVEVTAAAPTRTHSTTLTLDLSAVTPSQPLLLTPADNALAQSARPLFTWQAVESYATYDLEIALDPAFSQIVESAYGLDSPSYTPAAGLRLLTTYYWRVQARNGCGVSPYSAVFHFTTWDGRMGVDSTLDAVDTSPGDGVCAAGGVCTLRAAVQEANAQKTADPLTITLPAGTYRLTIPGEWENEAATGDLDVTSNLVIEGAAEQGSKGAGENSALSIIDGNNAVTGDRVFHIPDDGRLTLRGVTVQGGRTSTGGGIYSNGTLTITQSTVTGNTSYGLLFAGGGGIYNTGQLIVEDSVITTNHADDRGGAIYSIGAAADTTLRRVDVIDNSSNYGGAFFMELGVFTMEDTVIDDNALGRAGGGFYLSSTSGVIRRSTVRSNFSNDEGGGMAVYNTTLTIEDSTLSDNEAYEDGGAMAVYNSTLTIINSTFSGNHAYNDWGGAIYASGSTVDLSSVTITGNTAISGGGMKHDGNLMTLRNTLVAGNSATNYGPDCRGDITLAGYNLIQVTDDCTLLGDLTGLLTNVSPVLGGLQNNGGNTETHALLAGSPAIDAGNPAGCADAGGNELATDQRGYDRHADGDENGTFICDLGAYEYTSAPAPDFTLTAAPTSQSLCAPAEAVYDLTLESILGFSESVTLSARGQPAGTAATFTSNPVVPPDSSQLTIGNTSAANYGSYTIVVSGTAASASHSASVGLTLYTAVPQPPVLQSPTNGATYVARQPAFTWQAAVQGRTYYLEVAADPSFTNVVYSATVTGTSHTATTVLAARTLHYWRVRAENTCGLGGYSAVFSFTTAPTDFSLVATPGEQSICAPAEAVYNVVVSGESDPVTLSTSGVPAGATATFSVNPVYTPGDSVLTIGNTGAAADGRYGISIVGQTPEYTHDTTVILNLNTTAPPPPTLLTPADGTNNQTLQPLFTWEAAGAGAIYDLEVATDSSFNNVVITATGLTEASYTPSAYLTFDTTYFWRVRSSNACGSGAYSVVYAFTTWSGVLAVNDTGDQVDANPGDGLCEAGPGVCTLRAAVQEANASAGNGTVTINLPAGTFKLRRAGVGEDYAAAGDLDIRVHVTIQGAGPDLTIIDANSVVTGDRVFHLPVATAAATLAGVTLENGHGTGGGIHNSGSVTLTQVIVTQNDVTAIQNYGDLFIVDSHITNNSGVYGGAINSSGDLTVLRSTISNNDADTTGGALYHNGNTAVFDSSIISGNSAYWAGGLQSFDGTLTLINSTVSGNTGVEGGGVRVDGGTAYINNSTLTGNSATNGGGFQGDGGTTTLSNSILAGNSATIGLDCQGPLASAGYNLLGNDAGCAFSAYTG
ncbi:MAG: choice-of-anchor Q domain-containing protein, partial [Chloroflexota bacterium]